MAYTGTSIPIPLGEIGLRTDSPMTSLPPNALILANNVSLYAGRVEKARGTTKYNEAALPSTEVVGVFDWLPASGLQRLIALTGDGKIWRDTGDRTFTGGTPIANLATTVSTDAHMVTGGQEEAGNNKKLFIFTGGAKQIQIIDGDASTVREISRPSPDWEDGNFPTYGIQYQGRMAVFGSGADRHRVYLSTLDDHENFAGQTVPNSRWELWQLAATDTSLTANVQAGLQVTILPTTNNYGYEVQAAVPFNKFVMNVTVAATGAPVYSYEYWNGALWNPLVLTTSPNYAVTGTQTAEFVAPGDWAVGDGAEGGNANYYTVRVRATTAPTTAVQISSLVVTDTTSEALPPTFSIYPGEGDTILTSAVYRGLLFLLKRPFGVYILDGTQPNTSNWSVVRYSDAFGVDSPHSVLQVLTDLIAANSFGSYTSLQASDAYGDFEAGDILANNAIEAYIRSIFNSNGLSVSQCVYYPEKKLAYFTGQSSSVDIRNQMLVFDVSREPIKFSIDTKERPNCIALRKDSSGIQRPMYGAVDGFVYLMDQETYNRAGEPYTGEFQTAYTDFSFANSELGAKNKLFDFLEVNYVATGNNRFYCDVYIDGSFRQTLTFIQKYGTGLDSFVLDVDRLAGDPAGSSNRKPLLSCTGRRISFRFYNNAFNEAFKIERIVVSFRISGEQIYGGQT